MATATSRASADPTDPSANSTATTLASCDSPPDNADATAANRNAFIQTWMSRISDKAWFANFAKQGTLPDGVANDPYYSMGKDTQAWLVSCLVDNMLASASESPSGDDLQRLQIGLDFVIFGKAQLRQLRQQLNEPAPTAPQVPTSELNTPPAMQNAENALANSPSLTTASLPKADVTTPVTTTSSNLAGNASARLQDLANAPQQAVTESTSSAGYTGHPDVTTVDPNALLNRLSGLDGVLTTPIVAFLLQALQDLLQLIANIQQKLFTIPGLNLLAAAFYRVCAESATQPLACSVSLPVGVPNLIDVTGDNFPDMTADVTPLLNTTSVGVKVYFAKLITAQQPLPAHIFIVYDTPIVKKRIEFGFDGRASTLAKQSTTTVWVKNILKAATGDVDVTASINSIAPGSTESLTFAIKDLVGGSIGHPPVEANPTAGAVQFSPFPTSLDAEAHFVHTSSQDEDTISLDSSTPSTVNALVTQDTTTTSPQSHREFSALVDQMPTSVGVDLLHQGETQTITYSASAPISHVQASDTATPDTSHPGSFTHSIYDVHGVPSSVQIELTGAQDIKYQASASIPEATFSTVTEKDSVVQQQITAQAHSIPSTIHVQNVTDADQTHVVYDADAPLGDVALTMYDLSPDNPANKSNLVAFAQTIPQHMEFTQTKSTGVLDFVANAGIGLIQVDFSRADGEIIPLAGDHATVHKVDDALGLQLQLTGFKSAHFDGSQKTIVSLGLDPGGQEFNALADLDDPNILAKAHIAALPSSMTVTIDPEGGAVTYAADRVIPELDGSFEQRDTSTVGSFTLLGLPQNITLGFNTTGAAPQITYEADSRLTSIVGDYQKAPNDLSFHASIQDLPQFMSIHGQDPTVFDARTSSSDPIGSSYLGQVHFDYATDGAFQHAVTADDHVLLDTTGGQTHAELQYTGLQYLSADTTNQNLHVEVRNVADRLMRAFVTTDNLTASAFIDSVPAKVQIDMVGNDIQYHASSSINEIYANVQRTNGDTIEADVTNIPNFIDVLADMGNSEIDWTANGHTGGISVVAHLTGATLGTDRAYDAELTINDIPSHWSVTFPNGNVDFEAGGTGIGFIDARVTNHTSYHTLSGDFLHAFYDDPTGNLDAALHISNLKKAAFSKVADSGDGGGFVADLNMGNHGQFNFGAEINRGTDSLTVSGDFTHLPSTIHLSSIGGRIIYNGNDNPTLTVSVSAGDNDAVAALPSFASVHGLAIRDASSSTGNAYAAKVFITGLPDHLDLNSVAGTYEVDNFAPTQDPLVVNAVLNTIADQPVTLNVEQNIGLGTPVSFTFGPFLSSTDPDQTHHMSLNYTASRDLGSLTAEATYGTVKPTDAKLFISEIPGGTSPSISVNAAFGPAQKTINLSMSHDISEITAWFKYADQSSFQASADLTDVPKTVNLTIGRTSADDGNGKTITTPDFDYTADHAGMSITAFASADITEPLQLDAEAHLAITHLGQHVTASLDGTSLHITSDPETWDFSLIAAGTLDLDVDLGFSASPFENTGTLTVHSVIHQLTVGFTHATDLRLDLGITSGLSGDFASFTIAESSDTTVHIVDHFHFVLDLDVFGTVDVPIVDADANLELGNVIAGFHLNTNTEGFLGLLHLTALLAHCDIGINYRPATVPDADQPPPGSTLTVGPPPDDGHSPAAWLITPIPSIVSGILPSFAYDVLAFFESPYGHDISPGIDCDFGP